MTRELWTVAEAAEHMGCSEKTVRRLLESGKLPYIRISARITRIDPGDVEIYLESVRVRAGALQQKQKAKGRRPWMEKPRGGLNNSGYYPGMKVV